ncbi:MAG: ATP-binding protein [Acidobacteriota bacterium]
MIVFSGPPCSGKTALAERIAFRTGIRYFQMDAVRMRLIPDGRHDKDQRDIAYRAVHLMAETILLLDQSAILDATYGPAEHRRELEGIAERTRAQIFLIECRVSPETAVRRFEQRKPGHPAIDLTPQRVAEHVRDFPYSFEGLVVDTEASFESCLTQAEQYIIASRPIQARTWSRPPQTPTAKPEASQLRSPDSSHSPRRYVLGCQELEVFAVAGGVFRPNLGDNGFKVWPEPFDNAGHEFGEYF